MSTPQVVYNPFINNLDYIGAPEQSQGFVKGPASSNDGDIAFFSGTSGTQLEDLNLNVSLFDNIITTWSDENGAFNAIAGNGYFIQGTSTALLPSNPTNGTSIAFIVSSLDILTIQAQNNHSIQIGKDRSGANGTAMSTIFGDSVELIFHITDLTWYAFTSPTGIWDVST